MFLWKPVYDWLFFSGAVGLLWFFVWCLVIHPSPENHPTISETEKKYIMDSLEAKTGDKVLYTLDFFIRIVLEALWLFNKQLSIILAWWFLRNSRKKEKVHYTLYFEISINFNDTLRQPCFTFWLDRPSIHRNVEKT